MRPSAALLAFFLVAMASLSGERTHAAGDSAQRLQQAMRTSGDLQRLQRSLAASRQTLQDEIKYKDPAMANVLGPVLAARYEADVIDAAIAQHMAAGVDETHLAAIEGWSASPEMRRINDAVRDSLLGPPRRSTGIPEARRTLLLRVANGMMLPLEAQTWAKYWDFLAAHVRPLSPGLVNVLNSPHGGDQFSRAEFLVDTWIASALQNIDDATLERYAAFAESDAGSGYFGAYATVVSPEWKDGWVVATTSALESAVKSIPMTEPLPISGALPEPPAPSIASSAAESMAQRPELAAMSVDALMEGARRKLDWRPAPGFEADAVTLLLEAERRLPDDARVQTMLGEAELASRPGPKPIDGMLRLPHAVDPAYVAAAERRFRRALELDPDFTEAYVNLGRVAFHLHRDEQAAGYFREARKRAPFSDWLPLFEADLAMVAGDGARALEGYRAVMDSDSPAVALHARRNLLEAFVAAGRAEEFLPVAMAQLEKTPRDNDFRFDIASHLLRSREDPDRVLAVLGPIPARVLPRKQQLFRIAAQALRAARLRESGGDATQADRIMLAQASQFPGGPDHVFVELCPFPELVDAAVAFVRAGDHRNLRPRLIDCAVSTRRFDLLSQLAGEGLSLDAPVVGMRRQTALAEAVAQGDLEMFEKLLELGADPERAYPGESLRARLIEAGPAGVGMLAALDRHERR